MPGFYRLSCDHVLAKAIADGLHEAPGIRREDVVNSLGEVKRENASVGNGEAQYAT